MQTITVQGRPLKPSDVAQIGQWMKEHPQWHRRRLSEHLALEWNWRNGAGRLKDMAERTLLVKLEERGMVQLPARRQTPHGTPIK
mgnify:CR=1 FL=1